MLYYFDQIFTPYHRAAEIIHERRTDEEQGRGGGVETRAVSTSLAEKRRVPVDHG